MATKRVLYECDPMKNKLCKKHSCAHSPLSDKKLCRYTTNREFAIDPNKFTLVPGRRNN